MGRLHCDTCTCGDDEPLPGRARTNTRAPFYGLVIEIDRLSLDEQRQRFRQTLAEHQTEGKTS